MRRADGRHASAHGIFRTAWFGPEQRLRQFRGVGQRLIPTYACGARPSRSISRYGGRMDSVDRYLTANWGELAAVMVINAGIAGGHRDNFRRSLRPSIENACGGSSPSSGIVRTAQAGGSWLQAGQYRRSMRGRRRTFQAVNTRRQQGRTAVTVAAHGDRVYLLAYDRYAVRCRTAVVDDGRLQFALAPRQRRIYNYPRRRRACWCTDYIAEHTPYVDVIAENPAANSTPRPTGRAASTSTAQPLCGSPMPR